MVKGITVRKSPASWQSKYYVYLPGYKAVVSHHKTKKLALAKAKSLANKYGSAKAIHAKYLGWGY